MAHNNMAYSFLLTVLSLLVRCSFGVSSQDCPALSATFNALVDQLIDDPKIEDPDPELTYFKEVLGFRDDDIQHAFDEAVEFFNVTYGLDFSLTPPNDQQEIFFGNARMRPIRFKEEIDFKVILNNWIVSGSTRSTCAKLHAGEYQVTFLGDQPLRGSYGGENGQPASIGTFVFKGFFRIDVCDQSPVIIEYQTATPFRAEPVDGQVPINFDVYNSVLGAGKARGVLIDEPDARNPGKFHLVIEFIFTFPNN